MQGDDQQTFLRSADPVCQPGAIDVYEIYHVDDNKGDTMY